MDRLRRLEEWVVRVSLVVVCHHSSDVLPDCLASFRREARAAGVEGEVVIVEQSEDADQKVAVAAIGAEQLLIRPNRGYAAGLNSGIAAAEGEILLLANPDLWFGQNSLARLIASLEAGFDVVGPQLTWDRAATVLFPMAEDPSPRAELIRTMRRRWQVPWRVGLGAWLDQMWRVWSATGPVEVPCLRGPLLAVRRDTADRFGPLDEEYFLFYEETEWLWRARRRGARFAVAGDARVEHHWGHSTARLDDRSRIERAARNRFFRRNYGALWMRVLRWAAAGEEGAGVSGRRLAGPGEIPETAADLWLLSPFRHLEPAAGAIGYSRPPDRMVEVAATGPWFVLAAARTGGGWKSRGSWNWGSP